MIQEKSDILKGLASIHQMVRVENGKGYDQSYGLKAPAVHTMKTLPTGAMKGHTRKGEPQEAATLGKGIS